MAVGDISKWQAMVLLMVACIVRTLLSAGWCEVFIACSRICRLWAGADLFPRVMRYR